MSLIEIKADLTILNRTMDRIARALERLLLEGYQVRYGHCAEPARDPNPNNSASVNYATDDDLARDRLIELLNLSKQPDEDSDVEQDRNV